MHPDNNIQRCDGKIARSFLNGAAVSRALCATLALLVACAPVSAQTPASILKSATVSSTEPVSAAKLPVVNPAVNPVVKDDAPTGEPHASADESDASERTASGIAQPKMPLAMTSLMRPGVEAGENLPLTLNEAIRRALENNNEIEVSRSDVKLAENQLISLSSVYDPVFSLTQTFSSSTTPQSSKLGGSNQSGIVSNQDFSFGPSVIKRVERGGGQLEFFFRNNRHTSDSTNNILNPVFSTNLGVTLTQPLWRDRRIDRSRRDIKVQRKRLEQSDMDFRRQVIQTMTAVQTAYWDLVFALRNQQNRLTNLDLAKENLRRMEMRVEAGTSSPLERIEVQVELANRQGELLLAKQNVTVAENRLKRLIVRDRNAPEWTASLVPTTPPAIDLTPVNLADALAEARTGRPELRHLQLEEEIADVDLDFYKNQTRPRLDLQTTVALTGLAGSPLAGSTINVPSQFNGGYFRSLGQMSSLSTRNLSVGVTLELPWGNRKAKADLAGAQLYRERLQSTLRTQEIAIETEVRNAVEAVETARERGLVARQAREHAELKLKSERRLFDLGRSTTFLLIQHENQLGNARNDEVQAETDYNKALADFQLSIGATLRVYNVSVETQPAP